MKGSRRGHALSEWFDKLFSPQANLPSAVVPVLLFDLAFPPTLSCLSYSGSCLLHSDEEEHGHYIVAVEKRHWRSPTDQSICWHWDLTRQRRRRAHDTRELSFAHTETGGTGTRPSERRGSRFPANMASIRETFNASSTAIPDTIHATIASAQTGFLSKALDSFSPVSWFGVFLSLFFAAVVYDQRKFTTARASHQRD